MLTTLKLRGGPSEVNSVVKVKDVVKDRQETWVVCIRIEFHKR